jgi:dipeptidyl aminopeptidase/acylaminoacyl peptidase
MAEHYDGHGLRLGRVLTRSTAYTRYAVTYESGRFTISGILNLPRGRGPYPVLVLAHGYIDTAVYSSGRGLMREQDYLARHGYAVLHTDYRNHAQSDDDPAADVTLRLGYTEDVVNAVEAVKASTLRQLDRNRIGLFGRSLGGGVVLNTLVVRPGLVDTAVVYAPVSSEASDNFDRWIRGDAARRSLAAQIVARHGSPESDPEFWQGVSPRTYFDRVTEPVLVQHGTADESCPYVWSTRTVAALKRAGKDVTLLTYPGEHHAFGPEWQTSMTRTVAFFDRELRA